MEKIIDPIDIKLINQIKKSGTRTKEATNSTS